jgi:hypothetical protein
VRRPNNVPCNRQQTPTNQLGRWQTGNPPTYNANQRFNSGTGNRQCQWTVVDQSTLPPGYNTSWVPSNRGCNVPPLGRWLAGSSGGWQANQFYNSGGNDKICQWRTQISSTTTTPPNPIDPSRSPGFWAMIEGPGAVSTNGDAYNTRCYIDNNCSSVQNLEYKAPSNPDRGFWYVVKMPSTAVSSVSINVFDASYNSSGSIDAGAGDRNFGGSAEFQTEFRIYRQTNPLEFSQRTPVGGSTGNQTEGSCYWNMGAETAFRTQWKRLCTINAPEPRAIYLVNVRTTGTSGNGINGYALEAVTNGTHTASPQPALYAFENMGMQNNNTCSPTPCTPPPATFYLAEVGPQYAGKTLVVDLWDPGDASGNASLFPKKPSPSAPKPIVDVPAADCVYLSSPAPNPSQTSSDGGATGVINTSPHASDFPTSCGIRSTISGTRQFNGEWLTIRIAIPSNYTCTQGVNPETTANSCWWGIEYNFSASANDVTTWRARIEGNPVHLTR